MQTSQSQLFSLTKIKMQECLPPEEWHEDIYPSDRDNNFYFSALWHIKNELITSEIIRQLQDGKSLLSVGVGEGHLERLLVQGFEVPMHQIHVTDISIHPKIKETGLPYYSFDMVKSWPKLPLFDYVLFPESLSVSLGKFGGNCLTCRFSEETKRIVNKIHKYRKINPEERDFYVPLIEQDLPKSKPLFKILERGYKQLNKGGELRVSRSGGIPYEQLRAYIALKFTKKYSDVSYEFVKEGPSVFRRV